MSSNMTLSQLFIGDKITKDLLQKRAGENKYWDSSISFIEKYWDKNIESLSSKQLDWAYKIMEDMVEWRISKRI